MELSVLGPFEARRDGEVVALRRGRPRAVLVALLLRAGHVVSSDVLIDQVWGEDQPIDALNALQVQVSYLRRVLGLAPTGPAPALRTVAGGYVLDVDPAAVDADRFEAAVREARSLVGGGEPEVAAALDAVRTALGLWRGEALADLAYEPFVSAEVDRLHELRAAAREIEVDALLALGQHDEAAATLVRYVDEHPLRERLRGQLMVALVRAGRQAEALRAYDAARSMLVEELGVEPGAELVRLQRAVLDQDTSLDWAPRTRGSSPATGGTVGPARSGDGAGAPDGETVDGGEPAGVLRSRLPALTTGLVGREREVAAVRSAVRAHRMVTVTGPGGVGKTRVALAVAHAVAADEPAWLVELASVGDGDLVPFEIARAVGVATRGDLLDAVADRIGDRTGLLVLDSCEHLIGATGDAAAALLRACPGLRVLATSRRPVGVAGEVAWPLGPLAVPAPGSCHEDVRRSPAVRLFRERSREVRPRFDVTADNAEVVARICRRIDGLPLAIELAAARARVLSPRSILERIDDRFALLRRTDGVGDPRQQSLRATIEWSHELLGPDERVFFRRLGVFGGPFGFDAAAEVAAHGLTTDPLDLVTAMVEHSLITTCGDDTFRMLDTLRADAADRLAADPAAEAEVHLRLTARLERQADALDPVLRASFEGVLGVPAV